MPHWLAFAFVNRDRRLRNGWWLAIYLVILAGLLVPAIIITARQGRAVSIGEQLALIVVATVVVQILRRKPISDVTGALNLLWPAQFVAGGVLGGLLMLVPALVLLMLGAVHFGSGGASLAALSSAIALMLGVALAEELLFRGVLFQRMAAGIGPWPALVVTSLLFVLTHLGNPGMQGATRVWAGCNIFLASMLFGLAFLRTQSLAMPIGLHFMANVTQGVVLGFGVSGEAEASLLSPILKAATWLTGGAFGLEASLPGLIAVAMLLVLMIRWQGPRSA